MKNLIIFFVLISILAFSILALVGCDTGKKYETEETMHHIYVKREIAGESSPMIWISAYGYSIKEVSGKVALIEVTCPCYIGSEDPRTRSGVGLRLFNNLNQEGGNKIIFQLLKDAPYYIRINEPNGQIKTIRTTN
mgnify:CR=1 FL=1